MGSVTFDLDGQEINKFSNNGYVITQFPGDDMVNIMFSDSNLSSLEALTFLFYLPANFSATLAGQGFTYITSGGKVYAGGGDLKITSFSNELMAGTFSNLNLIGNSVDPMTLTHMKLYLIQS